MKNETYPVEAKIIWRYKGDKGFWEGYIVENIGQCIAISNGRFGTKNWFIKDEIEIIILEMPA